MASSSPRLLLVDDDQNTRECLGELLSMELAGVSLDVCANGAQALEKLQERSYAWLLTDQVMPGMTGLELTRRARALQPEIQCFVITGQPKPAQQELGSVAWLSKPVDVDALLSRLRFSRAATAPSADPL